LKKLWKAKGPIVENRHSDSQKKGQLTLSQGKMKKGGGVADDEDDDVARTTE
jgi:hypothetical protein